MARQIPKHSTNEGPPPTHAAGHERWRNDRAPALVGLGAILALLLPVVIFGPWVPLVDLIGFVGMYSYPPQLSYGPLHYYVFQLSYIGVLVFSRLCCDLQLPFRFQIPLLYLVQAGICFGVVYGSLRRLVRNTWLRSIGVALGAIAFWDGIFLWGGPLAHSLGAACLSVATFLAIRDAVEPQRNANALISIFVILGICFHPFILPFALVLCGVRFLFDAEHRWQSVVLGAAVAVFGYVIFRDSPPTEVGNAVGGLWLLWGVRPAEIAHRFIGLFAQDATFARLLFGYTPASSEVVFLLFGTLHLIGFALAPFLALKARGSVWLRMVATIDTAAAVLYFFSCDLPGAPISDWPERVLTLYAPFTFLTGFIGVLYLLGKWRPALTAEQPVARAAWAVPVLILAFVVFVQSQVFGFARSFAANVEKTKAEIIKSGVSDAYLVVSGMDNVTPFYLRAVPFVLFSDRDLIARHLIISTEWHVKPRHPTRITEAAFDLGRKRYLAEFSARDSVMSVQLVEQPHNRFPVSERTNQFTWSPPAVLSADQFHDGVQLFNAGVYAQAFEHFNTAIYLQPQFANAWNNAGAALSRLGQRADAIAYYRNAIERDPKSIDAHANLAVALAEEGKVKEAAAEANEVLRLKPDEPRARTLLKQLDAAAATPPSK